MTDIPAMLLWTDAYMADTSHLTTTEHGAYLLLLMAMWRSGGSLPNDELRLARTARLSLDKWRKISPAVMDFMTVNNGVVTQKRLVLELEIASSKAQKLADAGRAGGRAKALKKLRSTPSDATKTPQAIECASHSECLAIPETRDQRPVITTLPSADTHAPSPGRAYLDNLEFECRKSGGHENSPSPGFMILAPILGLIDQGADLHAEILPAIRAKKSSRANSWAYYVPIIQDFRAARKYAACSPMPEARAPPAGKPDMMAALEEARQILAQRKESAA